MGFESTEESNTVMSVLKELVQEAISTTELPKAGDFPAFPFTIFAPTLIATKVIERSASLSIAAVTGPTRHIWQ